MRWSTFFIAPQLVPAAKLRVLVLIVDHLLAWPNSFNNERFIRRPSDVHHAKFFWEIRLDKGAVLSSWLS
jgi:hypothetical protein